MKRRFAGARCRLPRCSIAALLMDCASVQAAQPAPPFPLEQLSIGLPEAGAPRAVVGPHTVVTEIPSGAPRLQVYRPRGLGKRRVHG